MKRSIFVFVVLALSILNVHAKEDSLSFSGVSKALKAKRTFQSISTKSVAQVSANFYTEDYAVPVSDDQQDIRQKIESNYNKVKEESRFLQYLDLASTIDFPVGIKADMGVMKYIILIDSVVMSPKESLLYASMVFETPEGKKIHFMGSGIKFTKSGGLTGDAKLLLVGDYTINLDSGKTQLIIKGTDKKTFVEFDCRGYKQLSLDADLLFSRDLIYPVNAQGKVIPNKNVVVDFTTTVVDWGDILVNVNVPDFQINGLDSVTFKVRDAVLDFSDTRNPLSINFPQGYQQMSPLMVGGHINLWRGVFIRELRVTLPAQFKSKDEKGVDTRVYFSGTNMILDNVGFSGNLSANNLIPINKGKIGNWDFSLDAININIAANKIIEGGFRGKLNIPINSKNEDDASTAKADSVHYFRYSALIKKGNEYTFTVLNADTLRFGLWKASVTLHPSSYIEIKSGAGEFLPKAFLNGTMTLNIGLKNGQASSDSNKNVKIPKLGFQGLEIQTVQPYIKIGTFGLGTEGSSSLMGGFPISIKEVFGSSHDDKIELGLDVAISLIKESDGGFGANGRFRIISKSVEGGEKQLSYHYHSIEFDRFGIAIDKGSFKFKGTLNYYKEDPVYGNGISGTIDATFQPNIRIQASAIFGTKNGNRYWYVDALATFNSGLTIFSGVAIYSFGGGAYYKMKIDDQDVGSPLGKTNSGVVYVPDETIGFGFKATIGFGIQPGKKAFNADVTFEMAFHLGGGLKYINFRGNGYFLTNPLPLDNAKVIQQARSLASLSKKYGNQDLNTKPEVAQELYGSAGDAGARAQVWASVAINYDFDNHILHGNMKAYVNVAQGLIMGVGPKGLAGEAVIHFAPGEWYIYIGRPEYENRFGIQVLGMARLDSYFVMGTTIPGSPPPPSNVSSILGLSPDDLDYMKDLNALGNGAGVGFGSSFSFDTGDVTFFMFYGRFAAGIGFDIMLKQYDATCEGRGTLGINGWYANGQSYAYFEGSIGIRVRLLKKEKRINILDLGAAVILQAKLPNPIWMKGIAGGYFNVLGGLVKGNCRFEVVIGEECKMIQNNNSHSVLESLDVLAQATPAENAQDVDVFTLPQAVFNYEIEKEYEMVDDNGQTVKFKISLDAFTIKDGANILQAETKWNDDRTVAALNPFDILPSQKELTLDVVVSFKEMKKGYWILTTVDGQPLKESHTFKFKTGVAPDYIPANNVAYSYPLNKQFNFYKSEYAQGYITLKQGQSYLFAGDPEWEQVLRFTPKTGQPANVSFNYVTGSKELQFNLPQNLINDQVYELSVVNVPKSHLATVDANVSSKTDAVASTSDVELSLTTKTAEGTIKEGQEKKLYSSFFRTSRYSTFRDKMISVNPSSGWRDPVLPGVHDIGSNIGGSEPFSKEEKDGRDGLPPLVQIEADLNNVPWYSNSIYPILYQGYPLNGSIRISAQNNRYEDILGVPPVRSVYLYQVPWEISMTDAQAEGGNVTMPSWGGRLDYKLALYMYNDYIDLSNQAANYVVSHGTNDRLNRLLGSTFPVIKGGDYWININYKLPGRNTVSSTYRHKIHNPID